MTELRLPVDQEADLAVIVSKVSRALVAEQAPEEERVRVLTVFMELARNIVKYAGHGEMRFRCDRLGMRVRCFVEAEDQGPGIVNVEQALTDHFSTGQTLGLGLPGVRRLMDRIEIRSSPGAGTLVQTERSFTASHAVTAVEWAWAGLPFLGNRVSGDLVIIDKDARFPSAVVVDVAGHGVEAHRVAEQIRLLQPLATPMSDVSTVVRRIHDALAGSGAIAAVMAVRVQTTTVPVMLEYCGVGNVRIAFSRGGRPEDGVPGMVGQQLPTLRVRRTALDRRCLVAVCTDGVAQNITLDPELEGASLTHVPSLLLRRHARRHDDATCLVFRVGLP